MKKILVILFCMLFLTLGLSAGKEKVDKIKHPPLVKKCPKIKHTPIVQKLITILETRPDLKKALLHSLKVANRLYAPTLEEYYKFLDETVTLIPTDRNILDYIKKFYYLLDHPDNGLLQRDELFVQWMVQFANDWGKFLDTPASTLGIKTFLSNPHFHIDDYQQDPSGWRTFNQFFARQVRPGKRPIACLYDDRVVVSPADSAFVGCWPIDENSTIFVKNKNDREYSIKELLDKSPYEDRFKGGKFYHAFLNVNDYHRYHVPVAGIVMEARVITGRVYLEVEKCNDGSLSADDKTGYQFQQARGLIVIDSTKHVGGYVAVLPIGMAQVSSCNITAQVGDWLHKGEEFGYFLFGGSDIIILFDKDCNVNICMKPNVHYNQGVAVAYIGEPCPDGRPSCPAKVDLDCPQILGEPDCIPCLPSELPNYDPCEVRKKK
ncbi:MAG: phosphatidylserine decarboxylase [Candidatus Aminicenantes bacterium]|nr:phosphatidylserine decarboxylase [Candidatus Aminicenantes bacterium]NIM79214.1 phosphatidylserine decarboxylase [Candidatus Aminicenantes bacterium]NIN18492.1 phosphatidylserine decarboxylase [Candidatus Aminicenantes bacterium]NIN42388.1 phosphatidylserine decarboxylase [Candidatus Aminicenantes bacterium]NIN85155.1 phosphatidylserine decarboxylase [Candidatus Aminicenantes bacterium]